MKNYQTLLLQIQGEIGRQTWWETREQHRGWGQSHVLPSDYTDLDGSHEGVETADTSGSVQSKNRQTTDKYGLTPIVTRPMFHTLQAVKGSYQLMFGWNCVKKTNAQKPEKTQDGSPHFARSLEPHTTRNRILPVYGFCCFLGSLFIWNQCI